MVRDATFLTAVVLKADLADRADLGGSKKPIYLVLSASSAPSAFKFVICESHARVNH